MFLKTSSRAAIILALSALGALGLAIACSSEAETPSSSAGASGVAGVSGAAGGSTGGGGIATGGYGNAGAAGMAAGGSGGASGSAGGAGSAYMPEWVTVASHEGCEIQRLANAKDAIAFKWEPCEGAEGCERARTSTGNYLGQTTMFASSSRVVEREGQLTIDLITVGQPSKKGTILFADAEGGVVEALRTQYTLDPNQTCGPSFSLGFAGKYIVDITHVSGTEKHFDRVVGQLGQGGVAIANPDFSNLHMPSGQEVGEPGISSFTTATHHFFSSHNYTAVSAMELGKPETLKLLYHPEITPYGGGEVRRFGERVSYSASEFIAGGGRRRNYWVTDGTSAGSLYLPSTTTHDVGSLRFAHGHVAWCRGEYVGDGSNRRKNVEIWASTYADDAGGLQPYKVGDSKLQTTYSVVGGSEGGYGHYALAEPLNDGKWELIHVWDLESKTKQVLHAPTGHGFLSIKGITKEYLWVIIRNEATPDEEYDYLARYRLNAAP